MAKRKDVLERFNKSSINVFDLTVIPNKEYSEYIFKPRKREEDAENDKINRNFR